MPYVYRYIDLDDNIVKYVGIIKNDTNFPTRFYQHRKDVWFKTSQWRIEYFEVKTITDAEALEGHFIDRYKTGNYYNKAKTKWGSCSFIHNHKAFNWVTYQKKSGRKPNKEVKAGLMKQLQVDYSEAKRILFRGSKRKLAQAIGMQERTLFYKISNISTLRANEFAKIVIAQELTAAEIMLVLEELSL